ncbi:hypothetical protein ABZ078_43405 [Streptomyces sp. NPDC006385]|uniref:DUF6461 domain-containing protein n=1 Tax=Streptomyces sp. NPDC006385 TaxID=3156761 RepID=UPI0033B3C1E7
MDLSEWYRECGAAAFTLAPTSPQKLLTALGVVEYQTVEDVLKELQEHHEYAWVQENMGAPEDRETPLLAAAAVDNDWSVAIEVDGMTGWTGCKTQILRSLSESYGIAYSCFYDSRNAQVLVSSNGMNPAYINTLSGGRRGELAPDMDRALTEAGFHGGGFRALAPHLQEMRDVERLDTAFYAVSRHHLTDCVNADGWIAGQTSSR